MKAWTRLELYAMGDENQVPDPSYQEKVEIVERITKAVATILDDFPHVAYGWNDHVMVKMPSLLNPETGALKPEPRLGDKR